MGGESKLSAESDGRREMSARRSARRPQSLLTQLRAKTREIQERSKRQARQKSDEQRRRNKQYAVKVIAQFPEEAREAIQGEYDRILLGVFDETNSGAEKIVKSWLRKQGYTVRKSEDFRRDGQPDYHQLAVTW